MSTRTSELMSLSEGRVDVIEPVSISPSRRCLRYGAGRWGGVASALQGRLVGADGVTPRVLQQGKHSAIRGVRYIWGFMIPIQVREDQAERGFKYSSYARFLLSRAEGDTGGLNTGLLVPIDTEMLVPVLSLSVGSSLAILCLSSSF